MDISFTQEQELIRDNARKFLARSCSSAVARTIRADQKGHSPRLWQDIAELGWMGLTTPETYGGCSGKFLDLVVLLEEMGRVCLPGPYLSCVVSAGYCLLAAASEDQKQAFFPGIAAGEIILSLAIDEEKPASRPDEIEFTATPDQNGYRLSGRKMFVPYAHVSDYILVACRTGHSPIARNDISLFFIEANTPGVSIRCLSTTCLDVLCTIDFNEVSLDADQIVGEPGSAWPALQESFDKAAIAKCAEMIGGAQRVLDMVVAYASERKQFGRPIGSFQAVQHHCANMLVNLDGCRWVTYKAASMIDQGANYHAQVGMTKAWCNEAYRRIIALGHQVLGGIGYCEEHDMSLYYRQARGAEIMFGDTAHHLETVATQLFDQPDKKEYTP